MIIQFKFKNFKSFRDEQTLSMVASKDKTLIEQNTTSSPKLGKYRLLRSAVIYGANASGKSNVVDALGFFRNFVRTSADKPVGKDIPVEPFHLDKSYAKAPSEFELTFIHEGVRYQYGCTVDRTKVFSEWLIAYPKGLPQKWFERKLDISRGESEWYFGSQLKGEKEKLISLTRSDALFLSVAAKFNNKQLESVYQWFKQYLRVIEADNDIHFLYTAKHAKEDDTFRVRVKKLLEFADLGIVDLSVLEQDTLPEEMPEELRSLITRGEIEWSGKFKVQLQHRTGGRAKSDVPFSLDDESKGTQRLFCLSGPWVDTLQSGRSLVVDELGSSLHPILVRELVQSFHSASVNSGDAQLIFNTHDTTLLDSSMFRRDQVWFVEKDNDGVSHLYPLLDFSPRKEESLGKWYLKGKYGAIPLVGEMKLLQRGKKSNGKG